MSKEKLPPAVFKVDFFLQAPPLPKKKSKTKCQMYEGGSFIVECHQRLFSHNSVSKLQQHVLFSG